LTQRGFDMCAWALRRRGAEASRFDQGTAISRPPSSVTVPNQRRNQSFSKSTLPKCQRRRRGAMP
jgi:hypothetical protein